MARTKKIVPAFNPGQAASVEIVLGRIGPSFVKVDRDERIRGLVLTSDRDGNVHQLGISTPRFDSSCVYAGRD